MNMATRIGIVAFCSSLAACDPTSMTLVGVVIADAVSGYDLATRVTADTSKAIEIACQSWIREKATKVAKGGKVELDAEILDVSTGATAFCDPNNPPPASPIAGAVWLGIVMGKLDALH